MANAEHVAILERGVSAWKAWRRENPLTRVNLKEANRQGANLWLAVAFERDYDHYNVIRRHRQVTDR